MSRRADSRRGFTKWDLLIIIAIVSTVLGLIISANPRSRGAARRAVCQNNIRQLGLAMLQHIAAKGYYPGYRNTMTTTSGKQYPVTWLVTLLPYLERNDLARLYKEDGEATADDTEHGLPRFLDSGKSQDPRVSLELLICPSDPPATGGTTDLAYVVNSGLRDIPAFAGDETAMLEAYPRDWPANGVFFDHFRDSLARQPVNDVPEAQFVRISNDQISKWDGTTYTLMLSENVDAGRYDEWGKYFEAGKTTIAQMSSMPPGVETERLHCFIWDATVAAGTPPLADPPPFNRINAMVGEGVDGGTVTVGGRSYDAVYFARPSSYHPGGVNVVFCDSHTRFLADTIDYAVYAALMTPNSDECNNPGFDHPFTADQEVVFRREVDESDVP